PCSRECPGGISEGGNVAESASLRVLLAGGRDGAAGDLLSALVGFAVVHAERLAGAGRLSAGAGFELVLIDVSRSGSRAVDDFRNRSEERRVGKEGRSRRWRRP